MTEDSRAAPTAELMKPAWGAAAPALALGLPGAAARPAGPRTMEGGVPGRGLPPTPGADVWRWGNQKTVGKRAGNPCGREWRVSSRGRGQALRGHWARGSSGRRLEAGTRPLSGCGSPAATPRGSGSARRHRGEELGRFLFLWLLKPCRVGRGHLSSLPGPHVQALGPGASPKETGRPQYQGSSCRQDGWSRQSRSVSRPSWLPGHTLRASLPSRAQASFPWAQLSAQRLWGALGDPARV